jgi:hypothetical protein
MVSHSAPRRRPRCLAAWTIPPLPVRSRVLQPRRPESHCKALWERPLLMQVPRLFDGFVEHTKRVSPALLGALRAQPLRRAGLLRLPIPKNMCQSTTRALLVETVEGAQILLMTGDHSSPEHQEKDEDPYEPYPPRDVPTGFLVRTALTMLRGPGWRLALSRETRRCLRVAG